jgi:two-component system, chemotaxis family, protein-glutamate methylesterase/glutaminase
MSKSKNIRVLVVDDSAFNRRTLTKILESAPGIKVVGTAFDGEDGLAKVIELKPDLLTLDLEMPRMDGFTLLRILMKKRPTPVIVVSSRKGDINVFKALELGAVDFIQKPTPHLSPELFNIRDQLIQKVNFCVAIRQEKLAERPIARPAERKEIYRPQRPGKIDIPDTALNFKDFLLVAIGASTGGPSAIQSVLAKLDPSLPQAYVVSLHMPPGFTEAFAQRMNNSSNLQIKEATDGDLIRPGFVYVAPGGYNLLIANHGSKATIKLCAGDSSDRYIPNIDKMFASAAETFKERTLGVVLTGMGNDGLEGVKAISECGGRNIAESEKTAIIYGMPKEAYDSGTCERSLPLNEIPEEISFWPTLKKLR